MISTEDCLWFVDQALDGMVAIVEELGDERASQRPNVSGANSAFAILTHCLGVVEYWGGWVIAGRGVQRDRDAEFVATGAVADLTKRVALTRQQLRSDLAGFEALAAPRGDPDTRALPLGIRDKDTPRGRTQGGALLHVFEELAQHHGQMELTRDLVGSGRAAG